VQIFFARAVSERSRSEVSLFATTILIADGVGNDMMDFRVMGSSKVL